MEKEKKINFVLGIIKNEIEYYILIDDSLFNDFKDLKEVERIKKIDLLRDEISLKVFDDLELLSIERFNKSILLLNFDDFIILFDDVIYDLVESYLY
jgi:hypothetical protein